MQRRTGTGLDLPRISDLDAQQRLALEHELVDRSICYARDRLGLGGG